MKKALRFKLPNDGTFQIMTGRELKIFCSHELCPPDMPEILFIKKGWSVKNKQVLSKPELHARVASSLTGNRN